MTKICCSTGKARIYYNIPLDGGLKYKLKGQTKWNTVKANEKLTSSCTDIPNVFKGGQCHNKLYRLTFAFTDNGGHTDTRIIDISGKITSIVSVVHWSANGSYNFHFWQVFNDSGAMVEVQCNGYNAENLGGGFSIGPNNIYTLRTVERVDGTSQEDDIAQCGGDRATKRFTVTGETTGTKYVEIEVKECPDVQTVGCTFDPGREQHINVELTPYVELPIPLPNYPVLQDCIETTQVGNYFLIEKVTRRNYAPGEYDPIFTETRRVIKQIQSPEGCPSPQLRIECCPNGICGEHKKCPPGTDCQIDCDGFRCCYDSKGNLIRTIKL